MDIKIISGQKLKIMLKRKGILQKDLIKELGIHQTTISRYFTDDIQWPASFLINVAVLGGFELKDFIEGKIEKPKLYRSPDDIASIAAEPKAPYINPKEPSPSLHRINELYDMIDEIKDEIDKIRADMQE